MRRTSAVLLALSLLAGAPSCGDPVVPSTADVNGGDADATSAVNDDRVDAACGDPSWEAGPCEAPVVTSYATAPATHIPDGEPVPIDGDPPTFGPHRPAWAKWGEYDYLGPQRWLHNLEHGGVAFLYHPCADDALVDALRAVAHARPDDDGGPFRWVMTPYPGLPTAVAVVSWGWLWSAECVDAESVGAFIDAHYRDSPEDFGQDGSYEQGWIAR